MSVAQAPARPLRHNHDFTLLWAGAGLSVLSGRVSAVAYPLLLVWQGGSAAAAGLVAFAALLPALLLQLPAGVVVDRWDRRRTMIACDVAALVAMASVAAAVLGWQATWLPHLMVAAFVEGTAAICYRLAERAAVRNVVEPAHLTSALSRNEARSRAAGLLGQPLGSALFALTRSAPFLFAAVGHAVALVTLLFIRKDFQAAPAVRRSVGAELAEGFRWLRGQRFLRVALVLIAVTNLLFQVLSLTLVVTIERSGGSPALVGVIGAVAGVGGVLGALAGSRISRRLGLSAIVLGAFAVWAVLMPLVGLTSQPLVLGALFAAMSLAGAVMNVAAGAYQVRVTPDAMQGRVGAVAMLLTSGASSLGALAGGFVLQGWGPVVTAFGCGAVMVATTVVGLLVPAMRGAGREPDGD